MKDEKKQEKHIRPSWREYFFEMVNAIAKRATCDRGRAGCVIVKENQVLATGYVGSAPGEGHCDDVGHYMVSIKDYQTGIESDHCARTLHAEQNAIFQAAKRGIALDGSEIYCWMTPCKVCADALVQVGIKKVNCVKQYHKGQYAERLFKKNNIELTFETIEIEDYKRDNLC